MTSTEHPKLATIRALLDRAADENGSTDAERELCAQRAAEMMARHMVTEAMLAGARHAADDPVEHRTILIQNPYPLQKAVLLNELALRLGCKVIRTRDGAHLFGHRSDLDRLEILYTSLLVQAVGMVTRVRPPAASAAQVRSYRGSWLIGFATRVAERMDVGRADAVREAGGGAELVLVRRDRAVTAKAREVVPLTRAIGVGARNASGYGAGKAAGDRADLGQSRVGGRRAVGSGR